MLIAIDKIHPSKQPIRESMDEEKLNELTESIRESGQKLPVKVRPIGSNGHYELIFGHRRFEALKRLGAEKIDALIESVDDNEALRQALIENFVRDDGTELEKAKALNQLYELERAIHGRTSYAKIAAIVGMNDEVVGRFIRLANDSLIRYANDYQGNNLHNIASLAKKADITRTLGDDEIRLHFLEQISNQATTTIDDLVKALKPLEKVDRQALLDKAERERLKSVEIEKVAAALQQAAQRKSSVARYVALETPGNAPSYSKQVQDRIASIEKQDFEEERSKKKKSKEVQEYDKAVKDGIEHLRRLSEWIEDVGYEAITQEKFSPEAARFVIRRFDMLVKEYQQRFRAQLIALSKERDRE